MSTLVTEILSAARRDGATEADVAALQPGIAELDRLLTAARGVIDRAEVMADHVAVAEITMPDTIAEVRRVLTGVRSGWTAHSVKVLDAIDRADAEGLRESARAIRAAAAKLDEFLSRAVVAVGAVAADEEN